MLTCEHISANANPMPNSLAILDANTIAFCFRDQVGLYQVDRNRILLNLNYREVEINRANCLCCPGNGTIVVGYDSGHVVVFRGNGEGEWAIGQVLRQDGAVCMVFCEGDTIVTNNVNA